MRVGYRPISFTRGAATKGFVGECVPIFLGWEEKSDPVPKVSYRGRHLNREGEICMAMVPDKRARYRQRAIHPRNGRAQRRFHLQDAIASSSQLSVKGEWCYLD